MWLKTVRCMMKNMHLPTRFFASVCEYRSPPGGFFLWLPVEDGEQAALKLWTSSGVRVLPGAYLAKEIDGQNPGKSYIRVALVAPKPEMVRGLTLLRGLSLGITERG